MIELEAAWVVVKKVFGLLPLRDWLWIGLVVGLYLLHVDLCHRQVVKAVAANNQQWQTRQKKSDEVAQVKLDKLRARMVQDQLDFNQELQDQADKDAKDAAGLKRTEDNYVGQLYLATAAYLPRGYILFRSAAAAFANGADYPEPAGPLEDAAKPSGVSFAALSDADRAQAEAYRASVEWGRQWQRAAYDVEKQCRETIDILRGESK